MKYLNPTFTVGGSSDAYRKGWDRIFKHGNQSSAKEKSK